MHIKFKSRAKSKNNNPQSHYIKVLKHTHRPAVADCTRAAVEGGGERGTTHKQRHGPSTSHRLRSPALRPLLVRPGCNAGGGGAEGPHALSASSPSALLPRAQTNLTISWRDTSCCATPPLPYLSTASFSRGCAAEAAALRMALDAMSSGGVSGLSVRRPPMVKTATEWPVSAAKALICERGGPGCTGGQ